MVFNNTIPGIYPFSKKADISCYIFSQFPKDFLDLKSNSGGSIHYILAKIINDFGFPLLYRCNPRTIAILGTNFPLFTTKFPNFVTFRSPSPVDLITMSAAVQALFLLREKYFTVFLDNPSDFPQARFNSLPQFRNYCKKNCYINIPLEKLLEFYFQNQFFHFNTHDIMKGKMDLELLKSLILPYLSMFLYINRKKPILCKDLLLGGYGIWHFLESELRSPATILLKYIIKHGLDKYIEKYCLKMNSENGVSWKYSKQDNIHYIIKYINEQEIVKIPIGNSQGAPMCALMICSLFRWLKENLHVDALYDITYRTEAFFLSRGLMLAHEFFGININSICVVVNEKTLAPILVSKNGALANIDQHSNLFFELTS